MPVTHAFLSRIGGVSSAPFASLNFDDRDTDPKDNIEKNRAIIAKELSIPVENLVTVSQVHGSVVHRVTGDNRRERVEADAIVTDAPNIPIGIMTADCLPALFYDPVKHVIGAAHGGWKGTALSVSIKTIETMGRLYGSKPRDIIAAIGPYIGPCCYNIGENVVDEFEKAFGKDLSYIIKDGDKTRLDIGKANVAQLLSAGVMRERITETAPCTSCESSTFFSYRKDRGRTGRQLSLIMLRPR